MDQNNQFNNMTKRDYLRVLFAHKAVFCTTVLVVCVVVFIGLKFKTKMYESKVKMLISAEKQVDKTYYKEAEVSFGVKKTLTQSEIVKSDHVLSRVVRSLALQKRTIDDEKGFSSPLKIKLMKYLKKKKQDRKLGNLTDEQKKDILIRQAILSLKEDIRVEPIRDTNMFTIIVTDYNPFLAAAIANVISRSYVMFDLEQQLSELKLRYGRKHPTVNLIKKSLKGLQKTLSGKTISDIEAIGPASVKIIEQASVALDPVGKSKKSTMALAFIMSILLAVMLAFLFEYTNQTIRSPQEVERILGFPFIGSIVKMKLFDRRIIAFDKCLSDYGKSYHAISDRIYALLKDKGIKSILLTSTLKEENTSIVIANLGNFISKTRRCKTLIIDANLSSPSMDRLFNVETEPGLVEFLDGEGSLEEITNMLGENLYVIPAGKTGVNSSMMLESHKMKILLREAREKFDIVIVNAQHLMGQKSAILLSTLVDGTVLVVDAGKARRQVIKNATMSVNGKLENVIGVILNERKYPIPKLVYDNV